jgi:serine/threonine protein kinase
MIDRTGQQLGNYRLLRLIGRGVWASVYLGEHLHLGTQAALKVLHTNVTSEDRERLHTEAHVLAHLQHPLLLRILDFDVQDGLPFLVMEYVPGGSFHRHYPKGSQLPLDTILSYVNRLAEALHALHTHGWVYRDLKPENLVFGRNRELVLTDFSLTTAIQRSSCRQVPQFVESLTSMAPERIQGYPLPASDQYALGMMVYEWLSGAAPFHGSVQQIVDQHLSAPPPSLRVRVPTISPRVERVVLKALAKDPQQRFVSVKAFALALEEAGRAEAPLHPAEVGQRNSSAGLTRREREVLRLLARGLTNPQIAAQLIIGLPTVGTHVASIYNKLGVTTRSAATRYALEHDLV